MTNSVHSFKFNVDTNNVNEPSLGSLQDQVDETADENITYSIFFNESDIVPATRNGSVSNVNDRNQKKLRSSRLYKFVLSTDELNPNGKNVAKKDFKNHSSLITLSTGILNSANNSRSDIDTS